ncbi:MAG TPA: sulfotransferase [Casimicrobiaceae bacterium]|nr:sulfotransferase [Casimicrobiaceae bacterium]
MAYALPDSIDAPVLLTGRGGSGTRMLSQIAERIGLFLGSAANKSGDSTEWVPLVYRMVAEEGGGRELPTGSSYRGALREQAQRVLSRAPRRGSSPWGLKLPETMLVLPLLIDAFPQAKVVHLIRHPVTSSLRRTHMSSRLNNPVGAVTLPAAYRYAERDVDLIASDEPYLHNAYSWNFQVRRVARYGRATLGDGRYLEIAYEDVCGEPARVASTIGAFLGWTGEDVGAIPVDASRSGDWDPDDPRVEPVWRICGETAMLLRYRRDTATRSPS